MWATKNSNSELRYLLLPRSFSLNISIISQLSMFSCEKVFDPRSQNEKKDSKK